MKLSGSSGDGDGSKDMILAEVKNRDDDALCTIEWANWIKHSFKMFFFLTLQPVRSVDHLIMQKEDTRMHN